MQKKDPLILVVDDDEVSRNVVPLMLKRSFEVETAEDATLALNMISQKRYDLILLDIGLKGELDGIDVFKLLRRIPNYEIIPIIAFTAFAMKGEKEKLLNEGFTDYISKPFNRAALLDVINKNL